MQLIKMPTFFDNRGSFTPVELNKNWSQCSISYNEKKFTFRGMHYQTNEPQEKWVKVVKGLIMDFMLDLDTGEVDFCLVDDQHAVFIPNNKAHGFLTLEDDTLITYFLDKPYNPDSEHSIVWSENETIKSSIMKLIGSNELIISEKDKIGK